MSDNVFQELLTCSAQKDETWEFKLQITINYFSFDWTSLIVAVSQLYFKFLQQLIISWRCKRLIYVLNKF